MSVRAIHYIKLAVRVWLRAVVLRVGPVTEAVATQLPTCVAPSMTKTVEIPTHRSPRSHVRDVDLRDRRVLENTIHELNAEQLVHRLLRRACRPDSPVLTIRLSPITRVSSGGGRRQFTPLHAMIETSTGAQLCAVVSAQQRAWQRD